MSQVHTVASGASGALSTLATFSFAWLANGLSSDTHRLGST